MTKYFCKWGFIDTKTVDDKFFANAHKYPNYMTFKKDVGYSSQDVLMIEKLTVGDTLDLSDGFTEHTITRVE
jgi:ABC-type multidrug transport system ATPase subunit